MLKLWKLKKSRTKAELKYNRTHDGSMKIKRKFIKHRRGCEFTAEHVKEGSSARPKSNQEKRNKKK